MRFRSGSRRARLTRKRSEGVLLRLHRRDRDASEGARPGGRVHEARGGARVQGDSRAESGDAEGYGRPRPSAARGGIADVDLSGDSPTTGESFSDAECPALEEGLAARTVTASGGVTARRNRCRIFFVARGYSISIAVGMLLQCCLWLVAYRLNIRSSRQIPRLSVFPE